MAVMLTLAVIALIIGPKVTKRDPKDPLKWRKK
jgi:hypothetical protein